MASHKNGWWLVIRCSLNAIHFSSDFYIFLRLFSNEIHNSVALLEGHGVESSADSICLIYPLAGTKCKIGVMNHLPSSKKLYRISGAYPVLITKSQSDAQSSEPMFNSLRKTSL